MSVVMRRYLPLVFFAVPGLFILFSYYLDVAKEVATTLSAWPVTLATFSVILGVFEFLRYHITRVIKKVEKYYYNVLVLASFFITFASAFISTYLYDYIVRNIVITLQIAVLCYVGFYNYTLFYRATRVRTPEVGVLIISAVLVMLWMAPVGGAISPILPQIGKWINDIPSGGAMRGILIGIAVGMIGLFVRACLGYEKAYIGGG